jgi:hypothetical protein
VSIFQDCTRCATIGYVTDSQSRHVSVLVDVAAPYAYDYVVDPANLPAWVAGLDLTAVSVEFSPRNAFGVLDHVVRSSDGQTFYNPMRVIPANGGQGMCEIVFTVRRRAAMTDEEFDADCAAVLADLRALKALLES